MAVTSTPPSACVSWCLGVPARGHGPKFSNWDNFRALPISLGHLVVAKFEFAQVDQYNSRRCVFLLLAQSEAKGDATPAARPAVGHLGR